MKTSNQKKHGIPNKVFKAAVVIPTFNEGGCILSLLDELSLIAEDILPNIVMDIVVVDGNSPDGTGDKVAQKMREMEKLHLIRESKKGGIGAAYCAGFKYTINVLVADVVIEFDGDFQHSPKQIPLLINEILLGYDYVVASRFISGGSEPKERGYFRKLLTRSGGTLAKIILFFPGKHYLQITDPTSGLRATRVKNFADKLCLSEKWLFDSGFGYKVQWLAEILRLGAKYKEIPLRFGNRQTGKSKFTLSVVLHVLSSCIFTRLNDDSTQRFFKFATVGLSGYTVNVLMLATIPLFINNDSLVWDEFIIWVISSESAVISNFFLNNFWTFVDRRKRGLALISGLMKSNLSAAGSLAIISVFGTAGTLVFGPMYRQIILIIIIAVFIVPYNWFMYNKFIWRKMSHS